MGFFLKGKTKTQRQASATIIAFLIVALGVLICLCIPSIHEWSLRVLVGWKGLVYLLGAGFVLELWFLIMGYRGKSLLYGLLVILFVIVCIWMAINFDLVWDSMVNTLGIWPTIIITLLGALGVWFVIKVFL